MRRNGSELRVGNSFSAHRNSAYISNPTGLRRASRGGQGWRVGLVLGWYLPPILKRGGGSGGLEGASALRARSALKAIRAHRNSSTRSRGRCATGNSCNSSTRFRGRCVCYPSPSGRTHRNSSTRLRGRCATGHSCYPSGRIVIPLPILGGGVLPFGAHRNSSTRSREGEVCHGAC
jgi:hypothetical protein